MVPNQKRYLVIIICNWSDFFARQKLVKTHYCGLVLGRLPHRSSSISCWGHAINWMQTVAVFIELLKWQNWSCSFMAIRVVEFSNGGYKNARFLPKNQPAQRIFFKQSCYELWSKYAEIVLSKSISYVKNWRIFFKKKYI